LRIDITHSQDLSVPLGSVILIDTQNSYPQSYAAEFMGLSALKAAARFLSNNHPEVIDHDFLSSITHFEAGILPSVGECVVFQSAVNGRCLNKQCNTPGAFGRNGKTMSNRISFVLTPSSAYSKVFLDWVKVEVHLFKRTNLLHGRVRMRRFVMASQTSDDEEALAKNF
jgi:hypothetical protein